jgi:hypothetical protein
LNVTVRYLKQTRSVGLQFPTLDMETLKLVVSSDASFRNRKDGSSQLGHVFALSDDTGRAAILAYRSYKARRVTRSSTASETLAFADVFDAVFVIKHDLERMLGRNVPVLMLIDAESLFNTLTRERYTVEKRLLVDIAAAMEAYRDGDIANIGLIASAHNPADGLTMVGPNMALWKLMTNARIDHPIKKWVIARDERRR